MGFFNIPVGSLKQDQLIHGSFSLAQQINQWPVFKYSRWFFIASARPSFHHFLG
jgi:hypothetical protein